MDKPLQRPRLFAGIALDERTRAQCAGVAARLEAHGFAARFESPEKLHITLAFLGNVEQHQTRTIEDGLTTIAAATHPFTLTLDRLSAFPHERKPAVVFIGSRDQGEPYRILAQTTRAAYEALGFTFKDDAIAHVTIARVKRAAQHTTLPQLGIEPIDIIVKRIVLFESIPAEHTTRYEIRATANLQ